MLTRGLGCDYNHVRAKHSNIGGIAPVRLGNFFMSDFVGSAENTKGETQIISRGLCHVFSSRHLHGLKELLNKGHRNMTQLVTINQKNQITTSSTTIAETFNKQHKDVIRRVEALEIPNDWRQRNFAPTVIERPNPSGGAPIQSKAYEITRDGFTLLAMGFTGKKAMQFKLAYIDAFNKMEKALIDEGQTLIPVKPHIRRLPSAPREIKLSEKARSEIGGIVKKCVSAAIKETLGAFLSPQEPLVAELKPNDKLSKAERKLAEAVVEFGQEKERHGKIKGMIEGAFNSQLVEIAKHAEQI